MFLKLIISDERHYISCIICRNNCSFLTMATAARSAVFRHRQFFFFFFNTTISMPRRIRSTYPPLLTRIHIFNVEANKGVHYVHTAVPVLQVVSHDVVLQPAGFNACTQQYDTCMYNNSIQQCTNNLQYLKGKLILVCTAGQSVSANGNLH